MFGCCGGVVPNDRENGANEKYLFRASFASALRKLLRCCCCCLPLSDMATKECIKVLTETKESLSHEQSYNAIKEIMAGKATEAQIGGFLTVLTEVIEGVAASRGISAIRFNRGLP